MFGLDLFVWSICRVTREAVTSGTEESGGRSFRHLLRNERGGQRAGPGENQRTKASEPAYVEETEGAQEQQAVWCKKAQGMRPTNRSRGE